MSATETGGRYTAENLAWEGDRASYLALDPETRRLVDGIARFLEDELMTDPALHEGCVPADLEPEDRAELLDLRKLAAAVSNALGHDAIADFDTVLGERLERERSEGEKDATVPSRASTAERKAMRLLLERRLVVTRRETKGDLAGLIVAVCRGDSGTYDLGFDPRPPGRWRCTCPELRGECSHLAALRMIV